MVPGESRAREEARAVGWLGTASPWRLGGHPRRARRGLRRVVRPRGFGAEPGPGWANPVPGRWPGRAGGAWPAASHTAGAGQGRGESREKRERIRGLIQNSNFSQRFFLKHEKL